MIIRKYKLLTLQGAYMPTMPEDILTLVRGAVGGGQFYGNFFYSVYLKHVF